MRDALVLAAGVLRPARTCFLAATFSTFLWLSASLPVAPRAAPLIEVASDGAFHRIELPLPYAPGCPVIDNGHAGFIPIRTWNASGAGGQGRAELFYWLVPRQDRASDGRRVEFGSLFGKNGESAPPLITWLQGGPGASSMIGLFTEMGPYRLNDDGQLCLNPEAWTRHYPMLFVDQPVGTGFSFLESPPPQGVRPMSETRNNEAPKNSIVTQFDPRNPLSKVWLGEQDRPPELYTPDGHVKGQEAVGRDMLAFFCRFFVKYPDMRRRGLYVAGESYAGKFVPTIATHIMRHNDGLVARAGGNVKEHPEYIDLRGIAVGNGLTDPASQISSHAPFALQTGLVSREQAGVLDEIAGRVRDRIVAGKFVEANDLRAQLFGNFSSFAGQINLYDIRQKDVAYNRTVLRLFLNREDVRKALHVIPEGGRNRRFGDDPAVYESMREDIMQSTAHMFPPLLERGIKVLLYQGQFDIRDGVAGNTEWIHGLEWSGKRGFSQGARQIWRLREAVGQPPSTLAGYYRKHRNLVRAEVLGAGHMTSADGNAPEAMRDLIRRFINDDWD